MQVFSVACTHKQRMMQRRAPPFPNRLHRRSARASRPSATARPRWPARLSAHHAPARLPRTRRSAGLPAPPTRCIWLSGPLPRARAALRKGPQRARALPSASFRALRSRLAQPGPTCSVSARFLCCVTEPRNLDTRLLAPFTKTKTGEADPAAQCNLQQPAHVQRSCGSLGRRRGTSQR